MRTKKMTTLYPFAITKNIGSKVTISSTPSGGTAPYTVYFTKNGTIIPYSTKTNIAEGVTTTYEYTPPQNELGTITFGTYSTDSCVVGSKTSEIKTDTVTYVCPIPTYVTMIISPNTICNQIVPIGTIIKISGDVTGTSTNYIIQFIDNGVTTLQQTITTSTYTFNDYTLSEGVHTLYIKAFSGCDSINYVQSTSCFTTASPSCTTPMINMTLS